MTVVTVSHRFVEELRSKADVAALIQTVGVESGGEGWLARWTKDMVALQAQYQAAVQSRDKATAEAGERLAFSVIQTIGVTFEWILLKWVATFARPHLSYLIFSSLLEDRSSNARRSSAFSSFFFRTASKFGRLSLKPCTCSTRGTFTRRMRTDRHVLWTQCLKAVASKSFWKPGWWRTVRLRRDWPVSAWSK